MSRAARLCSPLALWLAAPLLLGLSLYRPFTASRGHAAALPAKLPGYELAEEHEMTARHFDLLGTDDAVWRTYRDGGGHEIYLVALYHEENWKSVHPPRICLEGSDMTITEEGAVDLGLEPAADPDRGDGADAVAATAGRILAHSRSLRRDYVSLWVYGAPGLLTSGYMTFFWHHAPRAVLRRSTQGFLLRVEAFVDDDGVAAAEARCLDFLRKILPSARARLDA